MSDETLIRMANQIAAFFRTQPGVDAAAMVAQHLRDFWAPAMRADLQQIVAGGGAGLDAVVIAAVGRETVASTTATPSG